MKKENVLVLMVMIFSAIAPDAALFAQHQKQSKFSARKLIDSINSALLRNYIFPEKTKVIATYLNSQLNKNAYKNIDPSSLAAKIQHDISSVHKDDHLRFYYDPSFFDELSKPKTGLPPPADTTHLHNARINNFSFRKAEILNGNIGYVDFREFPEFIKEAKPTINAAFKFVSNTEALVIDLRNNGGGSPWMVQQIASYLVNERTRLNDIYDRRANHTGEFWADPAEAENMKLSMPIYILTSKNTFSAAEDFTYAMHVNKRAQVVGDTTGGGAHPTGPVPIGQGYVMDIPFARSINYITKTDWEGTGIIPDFPCDGDSALVSVQKIILEKKLTSSTTDNERLRVQWLINSLNVRDHDHSIDIDQLTQYTGTYERFTVILKENKLYLDDSGRRQFLLKPITKTLFQGSDWFQVEFIPASGKFFQMKMTGKPGWVNLHSKQ